MAKSAAQKVPKENILLPVILSALQDEERGAMHIFTLRHKARDLIAEKKLPFKGLLNDALKTECTKLVERGWLECNKNRYTPTEALTTFVDGQSSEMGLPAGRIEWSELRELAKTMPTHAKDVEEHFQQRMLTRQSFGHTREATPPEEDEERPSSSGIIVVSPGRRSVRSNTRQPSASPKKSRKPRYSEPNLPTNNTLKPSRKSSGVRKSIGSKIPRRKSTINRRHTLPAQPVDLGVDLGPVLAFLNAVPAQSSEKQFLPFAQVLSTRAKRAIRRNLLSEEQGELERGNRLTKKQNKIELLRVKKLLEESNQKLQELQDQLEQVRYAPTEYAASVFGGSVGMGAIHEDEDDIAPFDTPMPEAPVVTPFRTRIALSPSRLFGSAKSLLSGAALPKRKDKKISELEERIAALNAAIARHQEEEKEREEYDIFHDAEDGNTTMAPSEVATSVVSRNFRAGSHDDDVSISHHRYSSPFQMVSPVAVQREKNELSPIRDLPEPSEISTIIQPSLDHEETADFPDHHSEASTFIEEQHHEVEESQNLEALRDAKSKLERKTSEFLHIEAQLETVEDERKYLQQQLRELTEFSSNVKALAEDREKEFQARIETAERELALARESIKEIEDLKEDLRDERKNYDELKREHDHAMLSVNLSEKETEQLQEKMAALDNERLEQLQSLTDKIAELERRLASSGSSSEELHDALESKEKEIETLRRELEEAEQNSKEEIEELGSDVEKLERELKRARDQITAAEALIDEKEDALLELKTECMDIDKERDELKDRLETVEENFNGVIDGLRQDVETKDEQLSALQGHNDELRRDNEDLETKISRLEEEIDALNSTKEDAEDKLVYLQEQLGETKGDLEIAKGDDEKLQGEIVLVRQELDSLKQERDSLKQSYEQVSTALAEITAEKDRLQSDLRTALLDLDTANDTIAEFREREEELERNLDTLESEKLNLTGENNAITELNKSLEQTKATLLDEQHEYLQTIESNATTIADLRETISTSHNEATTLRAEVDDLTQRWTDAKEELATRVREIETVSYEKEEKVGEASVTIHELEDKVRRFKDEIEQMRAALSAEKERADEAEASGQDLEFELKHTKNKIEELEAEKMDLDDELTAANRKVVDLEGDLEDTVEDAKEKVEALEEANKELVKGMEDLKSLVQNLEATKEKLESEYADLNSKHQDLLDETANLEEQVRDADEQNDKLIEAGREKDKMLEELRDSLQSKLQEMSKLEEVKQELYNTIEEMKGNLEETSNSFEASIEGLRSEIKERDEMIASLKEEIESYSQQLEHAFDSAEQRYASLKQEADDIEDELSEEIVKLTKRLHSANQHESELSALVALLRTDLASSKALVQQLENQVSELQAENAETRTALSRLQEESAQQATEAAETVANLQLNVTKLEKELETTIQSNKEHVLALQKRHQADSHSAQSTFDKMMQQLRFDHTREIETVLQQAAEERTKDREASEEEKHQISARWESKLDEIRRSHDASLKSTIAAFEKEASKRLEQILHGIGEELLGDAQKTITFAPPPAISSPGANTKRKRALTEDTEEEEPDQSDSFSQATTQVNPSQPLTATAGNLFGGTPRKEKQIMQTPSPSHTENSDSWGVLGLWNSVTRRASRGKERSASVASGGRISSLKFTSVKENTTSKRRRFDSGIGAEDEEDEEVGEAIPA